MTSEKFWKKFRQSIIRNPELIEHWDNPKKFTELIMEKLENEVLREENVKTEREYFRIDLISYEDRSTGKPIIGKLQDYSWNLLCAVEHENDHRLWVDEVVKLAHVVCPLRVVIGYLPIDEKENVAEYLERLAAHLCEIDAFRYSSGFGEFMLILGDCRIRSKKDRCVYSAYKWNDGAFYKISSESLTCL